MHIFKSRTVKISKARPVFWDTGSRFASHARCMPTSPPPQNKTALSWWILALSLITTTLLCLWMRQVTEAEAVRQFAHTSNQITLKVRERLHAQELLLRGGAALLSAGDRVSRDNWHHYWQTVNPDLVQPGVQGFGFALLIPAEQLSTHTAQVRQEGFPGYAVRPATPRAVYTAIVYLEPFEGANLRAFGYDMYAEPVRRAAMARARDSGLAALSDKVELVQETGPKKQAGVLMYFPVYRQGLPTRTLEERRAALIGWSYSPCRMDDLVQGILKEWGSRPGQDLRLSIYDDDRMRVESRLYPSTPDTPHDDTARFRQIQRVDFHGQTWLLEFEPGTLQGLVDHSAAWRVLAGGLLVSALLFWLTRSLINTRYHAWRMAHRLTEDIAERERQLKETEARWDFALSGSGLGVWDWNLVDNTVFYSRRWASLLGDDNAPGRTLETWKDRVHVDDVERVMAARQAYLDGRAPAYDTEYRMRHRDGRNVWVRDRGMVIQRDGDAHPLRMIGTLSDVTEHHTSLARIGQLASLHAALSECNAAIYRCATPHELFDQICRVITRHGDAQMAWVGLVEPGTDRVVVDSAHGQGTAYLDGIDITVNPEQVSSHGAVGAAIRENHPVWIDGFQQDPRMQAWVARAAPYGWQSIVSLPLRKGGQAIGALTCYATRQGWRSQETRELFENMAAQISFALDKLESDAAARAYQETMQETSLHLQRLFDAAPVPMQIHRSADLQITVLNQAHQAWLGYTLAEVTDLPHWLGQVQGETTPSDPSQTTLSDELARARQGNTVQTPEMTLRDKHGQSLVARCTMTRVGDDIVAAWTDLTDIRRGEQALRDSEQRFRNMVEQTISGMYVRREGTFIYVNPRFCEMSGYPTHELVGRDVRSFVPSYEALEQRIRDKWEESTLHPERIVSYGVPFRRKDGEVVELELSAKVITWDDGQPATIVMAQDVTARKRADAQIASYVTQLENSMQATLHAVSSMVELRDPYTAGHERRVGLIAAAIGQELGWSAERCKTLEMVGLVHDIGKIAVPAEILTKPTRLSPLELALVREHAQAGYEILKEVPFGAPVADIIRQHHERMDGSGYPQGLKGEAILPEARVLAVADVIESMAAHRPYRAALGMEAALDEVARGTGTLYDPEVVAAALRLVREKGYVLPQ